MTRKFIYDSIASLEEHLLLGSFLASLVVLLFIRNVPATIISALAIPALIATFTLMRAMDFTLNMMTLLGLTLAVGIVIDDAIVVLENIFRKIDEEGMPPFRAAVEGTGEVLLAVAATSLSLVVIFLPVAFMTGVRAAVHLPVRSHDGIRHHGVAAGERHAHAHARGPDARPHRRWRPRHQRFYRWIDSGYTRSLRWSLSHRAVIVGVSAGVRDDRPAGEACRPFVPADRGPGNSTSPSTRRKGTSLAGMEKLVQEFGKRLEGVPGVATVMPTIFERVNHSHLSFGSSL